MIEPLKNARSGASASTTSSSSAPSWRSRSGCRATIIGVYGLDIVTAGLLGAAYSIPGSPLPHPRRHAVGQVRRPAVMYWTFIGSVICTFILSYPATSYVVQASAADRVHARDRLRPLHHPDLRLGFFMSLGKAAVYKHIPVYYPNRRQVGGVVGLIGGLGGFVLPIAFGALNDLTGVWTSCFMLLFVCRRRVSLVWMHFAIRRMEKQRAPRAARPAGPAGARALAAPAAPPAHQRRRSAAASRPAAERDPERNEPHVLHHDAAKAPAARPAAPGCRWEPEDAAFWEREGKARAWRTL
jgi:MFS transporter, NNP family, nitrate/nitrite transporter